MSEKKSVYIDDVRYVAETERGIEATVGGIADFEIDGKRRVFIELRDVAGTDFDYYLGLPASGRVRIYQVK
jgi:hypothetical protein